MNYLGNFKKAQTVAMRFNTHKADGTPATLAGSGIVVYKNSTVESTSGVALTTDYDSLVGMHLVTINTAADGTFYDSNNDFDIVISSGTVDGISVAGTLIGCFSIENRYEDQSFSEPGQGVPPDTTSMAQKINYMYKAWRNRKQQTSTEYKLYNSAGTTVDQRANVLDDGSTTTIDRISTGP